MVLPTDNCFVFIIETDSDAGNFEREICAYITGQLGIGCRGSAEAIKIKTQYPDECSDLEDLIICFPDEYGAYTPVTIWEDGVRGCSCVGIFFETRPSENLLMFMRLRAVKFSVDSRIDVLGFELLEYQVKHTEELVDKWDVGL